ncbi:hypothetical protein NA57DRAFT_71591 [Rhizodiscina lignyota]|uniref:Uncharacterized protein n=1 Tax=Rhizodiscina lignyota TaxID=1504668 RepID=A0A9P4IQC5_9PEZI|nr:hypothetical protein NA57DRAFT_71591 [Rhizodiscina lignyota]
MSSQQGFNPPPGPPPQQQYAQQPQYQQPPNPPPRRSETEQLLPTGQDRTEQLEYFQSYEANANQTEDDRNQETLQKEFPGVDSSLIAALYGDNKNMSEVRETLQELTRENA